MSVNEGILIWAAVKPIIKIALMCGVGYVLGRRGILNHAGLKVLGNLILNIFLPCLILSKLGSQFSIHKLLIWWPSTVNVGISIFIGGLIGWLNTFILNPPKNFRNHIICACAVGNTGNLVFVFVPEVCRSAVDVFGVGMEDLSLAYAALGVLIAMFALFSWAYRMLELPKTQISTDNQQIQSIELAQIETSSGSIEDHTHENEIDNAIELEVDHQSDNDFLGEGEHEDEDEQITLIQNVQTSYKNSYRELIRNTLNIIYQFNKTKVFPFITPPIIGLLISFFLGLIPPLQYAVFNDGGVLNVVGRVINGFGRCAIPCIMVLLGATFANQDNTAKVSWRIIIGVSVTRLIIIPLFGTFLLFLIFKYKVIYLPDRVLPFVMLTQWIVPSSININSICAVHQNQYVQFSVLLFWQYIFAIFTMPIFAYVFLIIVQNII